MGEVGGTRHYDGGGLGHVAGWACPTCGAENSGPLPQGCTACGAGRPGRHIGTPPLRPPAELLEELPEEPDMADPPPAAAPGEPVGENPYTAWRRQNPGATVEDAFTAGYIEGVRAARRAQLLQPSPTTYSPDGAVNRTLVAALELFREQVLLGEPEEVATGEWLSAHQVTGLIREIRGEGAHG
jgi:hypothetical protein